MFYVDGEVRETASSWQHVGQALVPCPVPDTRQPKAPAVHRISRSISVLPSGSCKVSSFACPATVTIS